MEIDWGQVLTEKWGPPLISILVGGVVAQIVLPRLQASFNRTKLFDEKRVLVMEELAEVFPTYIANWARLISMAQAERASGGVLPPHLKQKKDEHADDRNRARDELLSLIARARLYFSDPVEEEMANFLAWDKRYVSATLDELPAVEEWTRWERRILNAMRREALPRRGR
jgi:hypothetical protein